MKKISFFIILALAVFVPLSPNALSLSWSADTPYAEDTSQYYEVGDDCGYVMGSGAAYKLGQVKFTAVSNKNQGCVDEDGYFYSDSTRESYANYVVTASGAGSTGTTYTMDFTWSSNSTHNMVVDRTTGEWTCGRGSKCYARFTSTSLSNRWVWFDWTCAKGSSCYGQDTDKYHVYTDMETGEVSGYAWSDYFGFLSFTGDGDSYEITQELPPRELVTYVDILSYDEEADEWITPEDADYTTAPLADGYDYWRIRVQFQDSATGEYLTESDISKLTITESATTDSNVFLNQVENSGDAILTSYVNSYVDDCTSKTAVCVETEAGGSISFNRYIYSGSPTSNVLGLNDDTDNAIEYYSDRQGCRWIYRDQWDEVEGATSRIRCYNLETGGYENFDKEDVYSARSDSRNKYEIDYITLAVTFAGTRDNNISTWDDTSYDSDGNNTGGSAFGLNGQGTGYTFIPAGGMEDLSFRPRYQIESFKAFYDSSEHMEISEEISKPMGLRTEATVSNTSPAFLDALGVSKPAFTVNYQMDVESSLSDPVKGDMYLLIDTNEPPNASSSKNVEETHREDSVKINYPGTSYVEDYAIGYGRKASECPGAGASCGSPTNLPLSNPTAEQWVCDFVSDDNFKNRLGGHSCYYTEYLPHTDRHVDPPESMHVVGAINSVIDADDFLDEDYVSVLGTAETVELRNKMYAQAVRYTLGQSAGSGTLSGDSLEPTGDIVELMNGRLLYAEGDVTIDGCSDSGCTGINKTLIVKNGDVYINGNISGIKLGLVSFASDGTGGDVWVGPDVTDLYVNMAIDGSLFSYDGSTPSRDYPTWSSNDVRQETLKNQLYWKGSLLLHNTINGASSDSESTSTSWQLGDGTSTNIYSVAREYDLNNLRQYRLCYVLNSDGTLSSSTEECNEGEMLSEYGEANGVYSSFIVEYEPASDLPIFNVESGLFH